MNSFSGSTRPLHTQSQVPDLPLGTSPSIVSTLPIASEQLASTLAGKAVLAIAATGLMALAAHISLPLPFSPVPLVLTPFAVLIIGMTLGPITAISAMILYLAEGAVGLPVFSPHGLGGVAQLLGPTGGFLFSYPLAAATAGWFVRNFRQSFPPFVRGVIAGTLAVSIIFAFGSIWLAALMHLSGATAWHLAIAPFLPGEIVKIIAAASLFSMLRRWQQA